MADIGADRQWVIELYQTNEGRKPTQAELDDAVSKLQSGWTREQYVRAFDRYGDVDGWLDRTYKDLFGRPPNAGEKAEFTRAVRAGEVSRTDLRNWLATQPEVLLRDNTAPDPSEDPGAREDAFARLNTVLTDYGLGSMSDWAWQQIQAGASNDRILQELRNRPEYKQRFAGMDLRRQKGFNAIDEGTYISLERTYRQIMRAAGLPEGLFDSPDDFARFIGGDVSPQEFQTRVNDLYVDAAQAANEVRSELARLYGSAANSLIDTNQIAAYFMDPDEALPVLQQQWAAAINSGTALRTGYGQLTQGEAERLAQLGISEEQAQQGFAFLHDARQLMQNLPGSAAGALTRIEGQEAVFGGNAVLQQKLKKTQETRVSEGSGGQAFVVGNQGVAGLARERT